MKKLLILVAVFTISAGVNAQGKVDKTDKKMDHQMDTKMAAKKDCVMMEDGKMMVIKEGNIMAMDKDMEMTDGTMVMADGTVKMKNGKKMMMKDGDCMYMDGKMTKMKMDKPDKQKK